VKTKKVIDLYAGVGGLSLGAARAGFSLAAAVEIDAKALAAHKVNFPKVAHLERDVSTLSGSELLALAGVAAGELCGLVGGPPCQGFSEIGLQSVVDPRNLLFVDFFRLVAETQPAFYLAENVPGLLHPRNAALLGKALELVPDGYTKLAPFKVKANEFGAPTSRARVFLIGFDPKRVNALDAKAFEPGKRQDVRVRDALVGMPSIRSHWQDSEKGWRAVGALGNGEFQQRLGGHVPTDVGDPVALQKYREKAIVSGFLGTIHAEETIKRFKALRHGEVDEVSRARRLDPAGYCPTIRAGTGSDRGSFQAVRPIHHSSPRVIAPREAARLQGFPDWFQFDDTKWHAFRQIGNSVSPIVAEALLGKIAASVA
jgi:DNA (cytosine-5)-methyltransferase 1